jgi:hypothetical protein
MGNGLPPAIIACERANICIGVLEGVRRTKIQPGRDGHHEPLRRAMRHICRTMEAAMLAHTRGFTRKRRAVEFHAMRSPRDMLLSLPIVDGEVAPLAPKPVLNVLAACERA